MGNGAPTVTGGKVRRIGSSRESFDADDRAKARESSPVVIDEHRFLRRRKDWATSRAMRSIMRDQEKNVALANRLRIRCGELEAEQIEAATRNEDERETDLEQRIDELVAKSDEATEEAELVTYRLLALLLVPQPYGTGGDGETETLTGFGDVDDPAEAEAAIAWLQPRLDVEDAADLARELSGSSEPDPPETTSSESGSS